MNQFSEFELYLIRCALETEMQMPATPERAADYRRLLAKVNEAHQGVSAENDKIINRISHAPAPADYGTEHETGRDGLYCCCDSRAEIPPKGYRLRFEKTRTPATSPEIGTPAFSAWSAGAEVWEPVLVMQKTNP